MKGDDLYVAAEALHLAAAHMHAAGQPKDAAKHTKLAHGVAATAAGLKTIIFCSATAIKYTNVPISCSRISASACTLPPVWKDYQSRYWLLPMPEAKRILAEGGKRSS
jgi:hypothetical protein